MVNNCLFISNNDSHLDLEESNEHQKHIPHIAYSRASLKDVINDTLDYANSRHRKRELKPTL